MRVAFFTSLSCNVGDDFIREGIRTILDNLKVQYSPLYINKVDKKSLSQPYEDESEIVGDKYWDADLVIQSGTPVYWSHENGKHSSLTSEWYGWMWQDRVLAKKGKHPRFINLGAGSCQPWGENGDKFLENKPCCEYACAVGARSEITTVRDPVASYILQKLNVKHETISCPAFLAGYGHQRDSTHGSVIGLNLMAVGGHWDLRGIFDKNSWHNKCKTLCGLLRKQGRIMFVCHDETEKKFAERYAASNERVFLSSEWRQYFDALAGCSVHVANRVHGAVCAAGLGVPSIILGNDTRARIGEYVGIPVMDSAELNPEQVAEMVRERIANRSMMSEKLLANQQDALKQYQQLLTPILSSLR